MKNRFAQSVRMLKKSIHGFFSNDLAEVNSSKSYKLLNFQFSQFGNPSMDCLTGCVFPQPATIIRAALLALFLGLAPHAALAAPDNAGETVEYVGNEKAQKAGENERDLLSSIARRQKELDEREAAIRSEEERLLAVKKDIEKRIEELNAIHGRLEAFVSRIDEASGERVKKVAKIYASMNPEEAASRIERLDEKTAVMILATISEKQAAKILAFVNLDKSVKLSQSLKINKTAIEQ